MHPEQEKKLRQLIQTSSILSSSERSEWIGLLGLMNGKQVMELEKILLLSVPPAVSQSPSSFPVKPPAASEQNKPHASFAPPVQPPVLKATPVAGMESPRLSHILNIPRFENSPRQAVNTPHSTASSQPASGDAKKSAESSGIMNRMKKFFSQKELPTSKPAYELELPAPHSAVAQPPALPVEIKLPPPQPAPVLPAIRPVEKPVSVPPPASTPSPVKSPAPIFAAAAEKEIADMPAKTPSLGLSPLRPVEKNSTTPVSQPAPVLPAIRPVEKPVSVPPPASTPSPVKSPAPIFAAAAEKPAEKIASAPSGKPQPQAPAAPIYITNSVVNIGDKKTVTPSVPQAAVRPVPAAAMPGKLPEHGIPLPVQPGGKTESSDNRVFRELGMFKPGGEKSVSDAEKKKAAAGLSSFPAMHVGDKAFEKPLSKPVLPAYANKLSLSDVGGLSVSLWRSYAPATVIAKVKELVGKQGYHDVLEAVEKSPLYSMYIKTGLKVLKDELTFDKLTEHPVPAEYLSKQEFEDFAELLLDIQTV